MTKGKHCGAKTRAGGECKRPSGWGTEQPGYGRCKLHGGKSPNGKKHAERERAAEAVATYGLPRDVDPHDALLEELQRTAGHVAWLAGIVRALDTPEGKGKLIEKSMFGEHASIWLDFYNAERRQLTVVAKTCIQVGIEERRVRVAEQQGELIANVIRGVLTDLGVADKPEVPDVVRRHLTLVADNAA